MNILWNSWTYFLICEQNLKNRNKEELIDLLNETLEITKKQQVELAEKDLELEKKDKIISEMSNAMAKNYCCIANVVEEEICDKKCIGNNDWHCETCIKQYFERKAERWQKKK